MLATCQLQSLLGLTTLITPSTTLQRSSRRLRRYKKARRHQIESSITDQSAASVMQPSWISCRRWSTKIREFLSMTLPLSWTSTRRPSTSPINKDLWYHSYVLKVQHLLTNAMKEHRMTKCMLLLSSITHKMAGYLQFFSDKKIFSIDTKVNCWNDHWLTKDPGNVPIICTTEHPVSLHVLLVVSSHGDIMPPFFFDKGQMITKEVYLEVLRNMMKPWMVGVADRSPYIFQQDGMPAHNSRIVQRWREDELHAFWSKDLWPPYSSDLNPLDYFCYGIIERVSNKGAHNGVDSLCAAIINACSKMIQNQLKKACDQLSTRTEAVINTDGSWIEWFW